MITNRFHSLIDNIISVQPMGQHNVISIFQMKSRSNRANTVKYMYHENTAEHTFYFYGQSSFFAEVVDWSSNAFGKPSTHRNDANQWFVQGNSITFYNRAEAEFFTLKWI